MPNTKRKTIVVDSSVIVKWVSGGAEEKHLKQADRLLKDAQNNKIELFSSELAKFEVANALLKGKELNLPQAYASLGTLYALPINFLPEGESLAKLSYEIGMRLNITYYDAAFLSLAQNLEASLVTDNIKHQKVKSSQAKVIPLSEY